MTDEDKKRTLALAQDLFEKLSDFINTQSEPWMAIDAKQEPERAAYEKELWGKALLGALAQQLGIIEAALIVGGGQSADDVQTVREMWIRAGHRICMDILEAQRAGENEN